MASVCAHLMRPRRAPLELIDHLILRKPALVDNHRVFLFFGDDDFQLADESHLPGRNEN